MQRRSKKLVGYVKREDLVNFLESTSDFPLEALVIIERGNFSRFRFDLTSRFEDCECDHLYTFCIGQEDE